MPRRTPDPAVMLELRERIASHLGEIAELFDGSRDVLLSDDEHEVALAAVRRVVTDG